MTNIPCAADQLTQVLHLKPTCQLLPRQVDMEAATSIKKKGINVPSGTLSGLQPAEFIFILTKILHDFLHEPSVFC